MSQKRGNVIILLIAAIAVIGLVLTGYFYWKNSEIKLSTTNSASSTETANWKTYANTKNNFSFKYPLDWSYGPSDQNTDKIFLGNSELYGKGKYSGLLPNNNDHSVEFNIFKKPKYSLTNIVTLVKPYKLARERVENIAIDKAAGIKIGGGDQGVRVMYVIFETKDSIFEMKTSGDNNIQLLNQILSTFKFL